MGVSEWAAIGGLAVTVVGWFIRLERRQGTFMTRDEHEKVCDRRQGEFRELLDGIRDSLNEIRSTVHTFAADSQQHRERVNEKLGDIRTKIAIIQTRQGQEPDDTGRFKT